MWPACRDHGRRDCGSGRCPFVDFFFFVDGYSDFGDRGITKLPGILFFGHRFFFGCRFFLFVDFFFFGDFVLVGDEHGAEIVAVYARRAQRSWRRPRQFLFFSSMTNMLRCFLFFFFATARFRTRLARC